MHSEAEAEDISSYCIAHFMSLFISMCDLPVTRHAHLSANAIFTPTIYNILHIKIHSGSRGDGVSQAKSVYFTEIIRAVR